jgi:hypothetical protein
MVRREGVDRMTGGVSRVVAQRVRVVSTGLVVVRVPCQSKESVMQTTSKEEADLPERALATLLMRFVPVPVAWVVFAS